MLSRIIRVLFLTILIISMLFYADYKVAENVALRYMRILCIEDSESYDEVKKDIRGISPEGVRNSLFKEGRDFEEIEGLIIGIEYKIIEKQLYIIEGVRDYSIRIRFNSKGLGVIDSISRVKNWKVVDVYRLDKVKD